MNRNHMIELAAFSHTATCCETYTFVGKAPEVSYLCRLCSKQMTVVQEQVRSRAEAEYIVDNLKCKCGGQRSFKTLECERCEEVLDLED